MARLKISPHRIRERTLSRIRQHRQRFIELVQSIYDREGANRNFSQQWKSKFFNKFGRWRKLEQIMDAVDADCR